MASIFIFASGCSATVIQSERPEDVKEESSSEKKPDEVRWDWNKMFSMKTYIYYLMQYY